MVQSSLIVQSRYVLGGIVADEVHVPAHTRKRPTIEVTFTCDYCGETFTVERYPGGKPQRVCMKDECRRKAKRDRNQRYQQKRNGQDGKETTSGE